MFVRTLLIAVLLFVIWRAVRALRRAALNGEIGESPLEWFFFVERFWLAPRFFALTIFRGKRQLSSRRLMLAMMAKMADADGVRQRSELAVLEDCLLRWFGESKTSQLEAYRLLRDVLHGSANLAAYTRQFAELFSWSLAMRANAFDLLCAVAYADGILYEEEARLLESCAALLSIPAGEAARLHFHHGRRRRRRPSESREGERGGERTSSGGRSQPEQAAHEPRWATVLGCGNGASFEEVKRSYRKLVMMYHPDRLRAHGLPPEQMHVVTERFVGIQKAYEEARAQFGV